MTGYVLWAGGIFAALALTVALGYGLFILVADLLGWETVATVATAVYAIAALAFWFGALAWSLAESEKPPAGFVEWIGGSGPDTACEYVIKDDDTLIIVGKVPVNIEDSDVYTRCSTAGPR